MHSYKRSILLLAVLLAGTLSILPQTVLAQFGWFWQNPLPQGNHLYDVSFTDANTGTAVGDAGTILRTTNGGALWTSQPSGTTNQLFGVYFTDASTGTAVGGNGTILRTTTGGVIWVKEDRAGVPQGFLLEQNYPNPFNPSTAIVYDLPAKGKVTLTVYNLLGQEVATLVNQEQNAGRYRVDFSAPQLASGVYFYRLATASFTDLKKMMLLR